MSKTKFIPFVKRKRYNEIRKIIPKRVCKYLGSSGVDILKRKYIPKDKPASKNR